MCLSSGILKSLSLLVVLCCFSFNVFVAKVEAINIGGLIGSLVLSAAQKDQVNKVLQYYNEEGRADLFDSSIRAYGVVEDESKNLLLDKIVGNLSWEIAQKEVSIIDRPYYYFITPSAEFNAACGMGHVLFVNEGVFDFLKNDEDKVAVIVAHEMVHGQEEHVVKNVKKQLDAFLVRNLVGSQLNDYGSDFLADLVLTHTISKGITKPNEWQADNFSYAYLINAGYNHGAPAAVWQRIIDINGKDNKNFFGDIFSPSTHPDSQSRRDNFAQKLSEYSNNHISVDVNTGEIKIDEKAFMIPTKSENETAIERSFMIAGSLAKVYKNDAFAKAHVLDGVVFIGETKILQPTKDDLSAEELATILNELMPNKKAEE